MSLLDDDDEIWFGKHKGTRLGEIPASYLIWLADEIDPGQSNRHDALMVYIAENRDCLEKEKAGEL